MPKKHPGMHNMHVRIEESNFRILQAYCNAGAERLTASALISLLMKTYVEDHITPRMAQGQAASWLAAQNDIPLSAAKTAYLVEPTAFENPNSKKV